MTLQRAAVLYPVNTTTVDTGGAIDVRALSSTEPGATDSSQSVQNATQGSNAERRFNPANANDTTTLNAASAQDGVGWAVPVTDATLGDMATVDTACIPGLAAQTMTVAWTGSLTGTGTGGAGANDVLTPRASLWKYRPDNNSAVLIAGGSGTAITTSALLAYGPTAYSASVSLSLAAGVGFSIGAQAQVLLLVIGANMATGAGLLGGARTFTATIDVDVSTTKITFGTSGLRQLCFILPSLVGEGVSTRLFDVGLPRNTVGEGAPTATKLATVSKSFDLAGEGVADMTRLVTAAKSFDVVGEGVPTRDANSITMADDVIGDGTPTMTRLVTAAKAFDLAGDGVVTHVKDVSMSDDAVGEGVITFLKPLTAARSFNVVGEGSVDGRIEIPIDKIPEVDGGGAPTVIKKLYLFDD